MSYSIKPQGDRLLLKMDVTAERVVCGVILPDQACGDLLRRGVIVSVGTGCASSWSAGTRVLIGKETGTPVKMGDVQYVLIPAADILAEITDD